MRWLELRGHSRTWIQIRIRLKRMGIQRLMRSLLLGVGEFNGHPHRLSPVSVKGDRESMESGGLHRNVLEHVSQVRDTFAVAAGGDDGRGHEH